MPQEFQQNPFELSTESQSREFSRFIEDPQKVKDTAEWYNQNFDKFKQQGTGEGDLPWKPVADHLQFPGRIDARVLILDLHDPDLSQQIADKINTDPSLVLHTPHLQAIRGRVAAGSSRSAFGTLFSGGLSMHTENQDEKNEQIMAANKEQADELARLLGFEPGQLQYEQLAKISAFMETSRDQLMEALYYKFVLDQATECIQGIAPVLTENLEKTMQAVVPVSAGFMEQDQRADLMFTKIGEVHGVILQKDDVLGGVDVARYIDHNHAFHVMGAGHEYLHAVITDMLDIPAFEPGYYQRFQDGTLRPAEQVRFENMKMGSLGRAILEGISIAFEYELAQAVCQETQDPAALERFSREAQARLNTVIATNRFLNADYRADHPDALLPEPFDPAQEAAFAYSEGVRLALALHRHGWTMNDLPQLIDQIKIIVGYEAGTGNYDGDQLDAVGISRDPDSAYMRITGKIKQLQKPA